MTNLDGEDRLLLDLIQLDFPLVTKPYNNIGKQCGLPEEEVLLRLQKHISSDILRNIAPLLQGAKLGYKSTLAAVKAGEQQVGSIAHSISAHPGVSHNYLRDNEYNIWFTISIPRERNFHDEIGKILAPYKLPDCLVLPAVRTFKLHVTLDLSGRGINRRRGNRTETGKTPMDTEAGAVSVNLSAEDLKLLYHTQTSIPLSPRPWKMIGEKTGMTEDEVIARIQSLKNKGVIRRISGVLRHHNTGYNGNGMACFRIEPEKIVKAGTVAASFPQVSHCYERKTSPGWPFPLFAMIHAKTKPECRAIAEEIGETARCRDFVLLHSIKEFKKERPRYVRYGEEYNDD